MKYPIILVCLDDMGVQYYHSTEATESAMEVPDVRDGLYRAYDAEGRLLNIEVIMHQTREKKHWWGINQSCSFKSIKITDFIEEGDGTVELVKLIKSQYDGILKNVLKKMQFPDLINIARDLNLIKRNEAFKNQNWETTSVITIIKNNVDVLFVDTVQNAEFHIEKDDVLAGRCRAYDSKGWPLNIEVVNKTGKGQNQLEESCVIITDVSEGKPRKRELRELSDIIKSYYNIILPDKIKKMDLAELINLAKLLNLIQ